MLEMSSLSDKSFSGSLIMDAEVQRMLENYPAKRIQVGLLHV